MEINRYLEENDFGNGWDDETTDDENPYDYIVDETDDETEYGDNPAWNW